MTLACALQMQAQLTTLQEEKQSLDASNDQQREQLQAAMALHRALSNEIQEITKSLEQKCKDQSIKGDKQISELKVTH